MLMTNLIPAIIYDEWIKDNAASKQQVQLDLAYAVQLAYELGRLERYRKLPTKAELIREIEDKIKVIEDRYSH